LALLTISGWTNNKPSNVGEPIINHPPVITIFTGGMFTIPKWVGYDMDWPTLDTVIPCNPRRNGGAT
jgi:hypothetical protein